MSPRGEASLRLPALAWFHAALLESSISLAASQGNGGFSEDVRFLSNLAVYGAQGTITLWDAALAEPQQLAMFHREAGWHGSLEMAFSLDGNTLVAAGSDSLRIWQAPSLAEIEAAEKRAEGKTQ